MIARPYNPADLLAASEIVKMHKTMYGVELNHEAYLKGLEESTIDTLSITIEDNNKIFGVAKQHWWAGMPAWSVGAMFFNDTRNSLDVLNAGKALFDFMTARAEEDGRYDFYYIVRDSGSARKDLSLNVNPGFAERYDIVDIEVIKPYQVSKYKVFAGMMAGLSGKNTKTLVVRHGYLKPAFRQDIWKKT